MPDIKKLLQLLDDESLTGSYKDGFYVINLKDSNEFATAYTKLETTFVNTEFPNFAVDKAGQVNKSINYFEAEVENTAYNLFLIADYDSDSYYLKIGKKEF